MQWLGLTAGLVWVRGVDSDIRKGLDHGCEEAEEEDQEGHGPCL